MSFSLNGCLVSVHSGVSSTQPGTDYILRNIHNPWRPLNSSGYVMLIAYAGHYEKLIDSFLEQQYLDFPHRSLSYLVSGSWSPQQCWSGSTVKSDIDWLRSQNLCHHRNNITCREDSIVDQRFGAGLVFVLLYWQHAAYLPLPKKLAHRGGGFM